MNVTLIVIAVIVLLLIVFIVSSYNKLIKLRVRCEEAFATMDVYLKKRYDLIPNLVETVKGYASHEKETLENVTKARNMAAGAGSMEEQIAGEGALNSALKSLFAVAEAYPDLKAKENFLDLQRQLQVVEEDIANSRKFYNANVRNFNTAIAVFPASIIAGIFNFAAKPMYEVGSAEEREAVKVEF